MKLRLPQVLRTALGAIVTASHPLATTVATGTLVVSTISQVQATENAS